MKMKFVAACAALALAFPIVSASKGFMVKAAADTHTAQTIMKARTSMQCADDLVNKQMQENKTDKNFVTGRCDM